ncbi:MAG: DUF3040 domain-containing protein [Nocardiopsaceae bacterium]|nr:DUF3040 domain-containing protein [Nocardiopsaceae bacterium]
MALSMDEQRILAEIERHLAESDPGLAARLTAFKRSGPSMRIQSPRIQSPRVKVIGSVLAVVAALVLSVMVYAMIPARGQAPGGVITPQVTSKTTASAPGKTAHRPAAASARPPAASNTPVGSSTGASSHTPVREAASETSAPAG